MLYLALGVLGFGSLSLGLLGTIAYSLVKQVRKTAELQVQLAEAQAARAKAEADALRYDAEAQSLAEELNADPQPTSDAARRARFVRSVRSIANAVRSHKAVVHPDAAAEPSGGTAEPAGVRTQR